MSFEELMEKGKKEYDKENPKKAKKHFEKATKLDPNSSEAWYYLGACEGWELYSLVIAKLKVKDKDIMNARKHLEKAVELNPEYSDAWGELAFFVAHVEKKIIESLQYYQKTLELDPGNAGAWNGLGVAHLDLGNTENAIECYKQAIQLKPEDLQFTYNLGNAYKEVGDIDKAFESFNKALEIKPDDWWAYYQLALLYHNNIKDYEKSIEYWEKTKKLNSWKKDEAKKYINEAKKILSQRNRDEAGYSGMAG